ncbi:hypothetical protein [Nocardioides sp.]|uniref:hypothetical protein n=1 Tax=Nocardioides sp. TaxID=35761 RepID=UPI002ED10091
MALPTTSTSTVTPSWIHVDEPDLCALACAASAGVHGALVLPHAGESTRMGIAFAVATVALAVAAVGLALFPDRVLSAAVAALLFVVATAYLLSRTTGIPGLTEHVEPFDTLGTAVSLLEVAAAVVAVRQPNRRRT